MTAPAPGLPQDVERAAFVAHMASVGVTDVAWPATLGPVGRNDDHYSVMLAVEWDRFVAGYRAAMRAATAGSGAASAASAASAAHVAPGGEPVAWAMLDGSGAFRVALPSRRAVEDEAARRNGNEDNDDDDRQNTVVPLFTRPAPPVSASFDAALAALDVEPRHDPARYTTTYDILGLDDVRAAHRAEVDRLSARVAKLEAALRGTIPFVCTAAIGEFVHPSAKANRDAVMWAIHDLLPGEIRAEGIETPRAALEDKS